MLGAVTKYGLIILKGKFYMNRTPMEGIYYLGISQEGSKGWLWQGENSKGSLGGGGKRCDAKGGDYQNRDSSKPRQRWAWGCLGGLSKGGIPNRAH